MNLKEDELKDAVFLTLSQDEIEQKLKNSVPPKTRKNTDVQIKVSKPITSILKKEESIIIVLLFIVALLLAVTVYIW